MTNLVIEPEPAGAAFLTGAESDPIWPGPESAPGPRTSEAAQKSGRSATLPVNQWPTAIYLPRPPGTRP